MQELHQRPESASVHPRLQTDGWVVYLDVFGFSASVAAGDVGGIYSSLHTCHDFVMTQPLTAARSVWFLSDSTFLLYPVESEEAKVDVARACVEDVEAILAVFAEHGLPLRGAIAFGPVAYGPGSLVGQPVVRAVKTEAAMIAPLVILPAVEYGLEWSTLHEHENVPPLQHVRMKNGEEQLGALLRPVPWDGFVDLVIQRYRHHVLRGPYAVARAWHDAWDFITLATKA